MSEQRDIVERLEDDSRRISWANDRVRIDAAAEIRRLRGLYEKAWGECQVWRQYDKNTGGSGGMEESYEHDLARREAGLEDA